MFENQEREYLECGRVGRLATADGAGRPHVVPVCYALVDDIVVTPIDEKPKRADPDKLRRSLDLEENPRIALVVDHYTEDWSQLGWLQLRGTASCRSPGDEGHSAGVAALVEKYNQYADHDLDARPLIRIAPGSIRSWGQIERPE